MKKNYELIFHIGLPKTGTTALQKNIFPLFNSGLYIGKFPRKKKSQKEFLDLKFLEDHLEKSDTTRFLLSDENFTNPYANSKAEKFIRALQSKCSRLKCTVLISNRKPSELCRSWYFASFENDYSNYYDFLKDVINQKSKICELLNQNYLKKLEILDNYQIIYIKNINNTFDQDAILNISKLLCLDTEEVRKKLQIRENLPKTALYISIKKTLNFFKIFNFVKSIISKEMIERFSFLLRQKTVKNKIKGLEKELEKSIDKIFSIN